jgi:integrase
MKNKTPDSSLPNLTFPTAVYGNTAIPMDLRVLLYKGASLENSRTVFNKMASGAFGAALQDRIELVKCIYDELNSALVSGNSQETIKKDFKIFRSFFGWVDEQDIELSISSVEKAYRQWSDHLLNRVLRAEIKPMTAYTHSGCISVKLSKICESSKSLIVTTRLRHPRLQQIFVADEQNLNDIFKFGYLLVDVANCLNLKEIYGALPVKIALRNGTTWNEWSKAVDINSLKTFAPGSKRFHDQAKVHSRRSLWEGEHSLRTRFPLINLRLQAELLIFIAQTGINSIQAQKLRLTQASYTSSIDGYRVRTYKERKGGEVSFEIFSQYRDHFEKYLTWRRDVFKDVSELLFPLLDSSGSLKSAASRVTFQRMRTICKKVDIKFCTPRELRKTRINWLFRESQNPELTAEQAQHTKQTLYKSYLRPSLQIAKLEFIQFWKKNDPTLQQVGPAPALGLCDGIPAPIIKMPSEAPKPDCIHPGGCFFCGHHRDIDSQDYVWSLVSMRHLNAILIAKYRPIKKNKPDTGAHVEMILEILVTKLKWFESSNERRRNWVSEAVERCNEGELHPHWGYLIEAATS